MLPYLIDKQNTNFPGTLLERRMYKNQKEIPKILSNQFKRPELTYGHYCCPSPPLLTFVVILAKYSPKEHSITSLNHAKTNKKPHTYCPNLNILKMEISTIY